MKNNLSPKKFILLSTLIFAASLFIGCDSDAVKSYERFVKYTNETLDVIFSEPEPPEPPDPPLTITMRTSYLDGYVLQIANRSQEHLECGIKIYRSGSQIGSTRSIVKSGEMKEFGILEICDIKSGDEMVITTLGYVKEFHVTMEEGGIYRYKIVNPSSN